MTLVVEPSPRLRPFVESISVRVDGEVRRERSFERVLPTGDVGIVVNLREDELRTYDDDGTQHRASGAILSGPQTRVRTIDTDELGAMVNVTFRRGGAVPWVGTASEGIADAMVDLDAVLGRDGRDLRDRLLQARSSQAMAAIVDEVLVRHMRSDSALHPQLAHACDLLAGGRRVGDVSAAIGLSPEQCTRRIRQHLGMTPKRHSRIQRLQRVLATVRAATHAEWAIIASEHGYFDQAHLINDFRDLTGLTPMGYLAATTEHVNHVAFLQSRAPTTP